MYRPRMALHAASTAGRGAGAFTAEEHGIIGRWAEEMRGRGLRIQISADTYEFLDEALLVFSSSSSEPAWLVHKTPEGTIAVRAWPSLADIVATVPEALAIITATLDQPDA